MGRSAELREVEIEGVGHAGDGVTADGVFVPLTLPGERVRIAGSGRARLEAVLSPSAERVVPPCRHFGVCGACTLQHWAAAPLSAWKRDLIARALAQRGLAAEIEPVRPVPPRSRRRATLAVVSTPRGVEIGFNARGAGAVADLEECHVLAPALVATLPRWRAGLTAVLPPRATADLHLLASETGVDAAIALPKPIALGARERLALAELAAGLDLARLSWDGELVAAVREPRVQIDGIAVAPPPGGFLQPTAEGEAHLIGAVREAVGRAVQVADLFSGCGTFSLPLARTGRVHAVEGDEASLAALRAASGGVPGLKPVTVERRDLFRRPLVAAELARFEAVVFDPPFAGAAAQAAELARSEVPAIVGVSCNPATFARDARTLADGGYRLRRVVPVDQFLWSAHIELVGVFARA